MPRVFGLDLLRCVAVLMVLLAHTRFFLRPVLPQAQALSIFGFLGVELFFVLSGFLIGGIALRDFSTGEGGASLRAFWIRRWFRTLPNYYLFLALNAVLTASLGGEGQGGSLAYVLFLQNLAWPAPPFFNESWSLAVEEWFYLLFPLVTVLLMRLGLEMRKAVLGALGTLLVLATTARVLGVLTGTPSWDDGVRKVVLFRLDALMVGVLGACLSAYWPQLWTRLRGPSVLLGTVLFAAVFWVYFSVARNGSIFARTLLFPVTSVAVLAFLPALSQWREAAGSLATTVRNLSLWSYSLYLTHLPVRQILISAFGDPESPTSTLGTSATLFLCAAFVAISIASAAFVYRFYERPMTALRERFAR